MNMNHAGGEALILEQILQAFQRVTPVRLQFEQHPPGADRVDALAHLRMPNGRTAGPFAVDVKRRLQRADLGRFPLHATKTTLPTIIATEYVNPRLADTLVERNIPFLDTAGNAYVNHDDTFVLVTGRKIPTERMRAKAPTRAFRTAGLKLILALLNDPDLLNATYRRIADVTGVALGTIANVFHDLERLGYVQTVGDRRRIRDFEGLVDKWADAYIERMRNRLVIGRYVGEADQPLTATDLEPDAWWGGEIAAAKMTGYLKPETATIYARPPTGRVQAKFRLRRDPHGTIELLEAFWQGNANRKWGDCAPPIVVYADLLAIGDDRTIETARMLYEKQIAIDRRQD